MTFLAYARYAIWDLILVLAASIALSYTLMDGFYIAPELQYSAIPAIIVGVELVALFAVGFTKRTARIGGVIFGVCAVGGIVAAAAASSAPLLADVEDNYVPFALIVVLVPVACYLLSRRRGGTAALFIIGAFACAFIEFFYARFELLWTLVFVASSLALVVYKNYQLSARTSTTVGKLSFSAGFGVSLAVVAVAVGLGSAVWFGVIAPLNPSAVEVKLITEVRALETKPVQGTADEYQTPNMELTSDRTNSDERTTDDLQQSADGRPEPARPREDTQVEDESSGSLMGLDLDSIVESFNLDADNPLGLSFIFIFALIPLLIVAYFVGRRLHRAHRLKVMSSLPRGEQVSSLYTFLLGRLGRVGFAVPDGSTLLEFAASTSGAMSRIDDTAGVPFADLTNTYVGVVYGKQDPTDDELAQFSQYYRSFWKAARVQLGNVKYFFKSFRL